MRKIDFIFLVIHFLKETACHYHEWEASRFGLSSVGHRGNTHAGFSFPGRTLFSVYPGQEQPTNDVDVTKWVGLIFGQF